VWRDQKITFMAIKLEYRVALYDRRLYNVWAYNSAPDNKTVLVYTV